jgi:hypothetical protein
MPFIDRTILDFLLYDWLDAAALTELPRFSEHSRETFNAVLDLSTRLADEHFAPHAKQSDRNEPVFDGETVHVLPDIKAALKAYAEAGCSPPRSMRRSAARKFPLSFTRRRPL